jgi:hypothetical protein
MSQSTFGKWWPVTHDFGLIRAPVGTVLEMRHQAYLAHGLDDCRREDVAGSLDVCLRQLEPLCFVTRKEMYLATDFGWTALFQNGTRGSDPALPMMQSARALGVTAMRICVTPAGATWPAVIWEVYDTAENGGDANGYRRSIAASNDGGRWVFHMSGAPFPFEDPGRYAAKRERDRFPADLLGDYLREMGIPRIEDDRFLVAGACKGGMISRSNVEGAKLTSLHEAIAAF